MATGTCALSHTVSAAPHKTIPLTNDLVVPSDNRPIVISGPSGVGKGTLYKLLLTRRPNVFATSVSHTTREPRPGEKAGVDYYYIKMEEFEKMIEESKFVEHAKFGGNRYGTSKMTISDLTASGKVVVLDIEMEVRELRFFAPLLPKQ
jgi:guanylate kinase